MQSGSLYVQHPLEMSLGHKTKRADAAQTNKASSVSSSNTKYPRFGKRGAPQAFPSKLYEILEGENPEIVGWTPTGRGFEVRLLTCVTLVAQPVNGAFVRANRPTSPDVERGSVMLAFYFFSERDGAHRIDEAASETWS